MNAHVYATLVDAAIPVAGGLYATLLGYRVVGKKPGVDANYDNRIDRASGILRICGPLMFLFGVVMAIVHLSR